jgi:Xaa-Pro aminopeptidase
MTIPARDLRRLRLADQLKKQGGGIALIATAPEYIRSGDSHFPFRHDSYFHYLCDFDEPQSWLVVDSHAFSTLFCRSKDPAREIWDGHRLGPEKAIQALGVDAAHAIEQLDEIMPQLLSKHAHVWVLAHATHTEALLQKWLQPHHTQHNLSPLLDEMRLIKSPAELHLMRQAAHISAKAHARVMHFCGQHFASAIPSALHEHHLEAELLHEFLSQGSSGPAYSSIVATGENACILHYHGGKSQLQAGQLCLIDAGCEMHGYASDISRTFPVNGVFSTPQRQLYEVVFAAQQAAIDATSPKHRQREAHHAAIKVLSQGLLDLGLLNKNQHGNLQDVIEKAAYRPFYMHGTGHCLGRDVHDVGEYLSVDEAAIEQPDGMGGTFVKKPSRYLQPGMVVTIEPGLYVRPAPDVPECYWHMGIRIEDDVVVTSTGCELISRGVPVKATEIEALMQGR